MRAWQITPSIEVEGLPCVFFVLFACGCVRAPQQCALCPEALPPFFGVPCVVKEAFQVRVLVCACGCMLMVRSALVLSAGSFFAVAPRSVGFVC